MNRDRANELTIKISEAKQVIRDCTFELADIIMRYDGTLQQALKDGLVRLNFPAPPGFYRHLHSK